MSIPTQNSSHWFTGLTGKLPVLLLTGLLAACGGGGGGSDSGSGSSSSSSSSSGGSGSSGSSGGTGTKPGEPTLTMQPQATKTFQFSWELVSGASEYRLLENPDGVSGYEQIASVDGETNEYGLVVFLPDRVNASYMLQACNSIGCADSEAVAVSGNLAGAIGYIKASNTDTMDAFGSGVAISSDGRTLAIGASGESSANSLDQADNSASNSGAVYIYSLVNNAWQQQAYLKASNAEAKDDFGSKVSLSADGSTLAVGARGEDSTSNAINQGQDDNSALDSGATYVFTREGDSWQQQAYLKPSDTFAGQYFGRSISLSDDGSTLAVGAGAFAAAGATGSAYIFTFDGSEWLEAKRLVASNAEADDGFGWLALSGDGTVLVVGATGEDSGVVGDELDNSQETSGAAYVFALGDGSWPQQAYLKASVPDRYGQFGSAVAISENGNTIAVSAFGESTGGYYSGAVYVFQKGETTWEQQAFLKAPNPIQQGGFGSSLALSDDGQTLAIGAQGDSSAAIGINGDHYDSSSEFSGAAHLYRLRNGEWQQETYLKASNTEPVYDDNIESEFFGWSVALSGNGEILAVGAAYEHSSASGVNGDQQNNDAPASGAVYLY